jgi:hypothetical protein
MTNNYLYLSFINLGAITTSNGNTMLTEMSLRTFLKETYFIDQIQISN